MKQLFFIFLITISVAAQAQIVNIPDANFKNALVNEIVADTNGDGYIDVKVDTNGDGEIQVSEAISVFGLRINDFNINSLEGIQSFINITRLECRNNNLSALHVAQNTNLEKLECSNNNISNLDVTNHPNLKELACGQNPLFSLDISQNPNLESLYCAGNNLTSLDVTQHPNLNRLICFTNQLTSLDITQNLLLKSLDATTNLYYALDVSQNLNLEVLYCGSPNLVSLDVSQNPRLELFGFSDSNLNSIDVTNNPDLRWLFCENNNLTALDLSQNTNFERLSAFGNQLSSLNFKNGNNQNLNIMRAYNNPDLTCIQVDDENYANSKTCYPDNWCKDEIAYYKEDCILGTNEFEFTAITLHPNPVSDVLSINTEQVIDRVQIFSVDGSIIKEFSNSEIDVEFLQTGLYFAKIFTNGRVITKKFIKK